MAPQDQANPAGSTSAAPTTDPATCVLPHRILVAVDGSPVSQHLATFTAAIAAPFDSELALLRVIEGHSVEGRVDELEFELQRAAAAHQLDAIVSQLKTQNLRASALVLEGHPAEQIVGVAEDQDWDLLVIGSHGAGRATTWNLGGTAQKLLHCACCSLLVVPEEVAARNGGVRRILVPLDGSRRSECVLPLVARLAKHHDAQVLLIHAVAVPALPR